MVESLFEDIVPLAPVEIGRNQGVDVGINAEMLGRIETGPDRKD